MDYLEQIQRTGMVQPGIRQFSRPNNSQTEVLTQVQEILEQVNNQRNNTERILKISQNKIYSLEKEVSELRDELKKATEVLTKLRDKEVVQKTREALFNRQERAPVDRQIDRNNVAPKDVSIEKIFNCSHKKF